MAARTVPTRGHSCVSVRRDRCPTAATDTHLCAATVPNAGSVRFSDAPGGRGTEVHVTLEYDPPAGRLGQLVAKLFGEEPDVQVREDLRRFKAIMEAGEAPTNDMRAGERTQVDA